MLRRPAEEPVAMYPPPSLSMFKSPLLRFICVGKYVTTTAGSKDKTICVMKNNLVVASIKGTMTVEVPWSNVVGIHVQERARDEYASVVIAHRPPDGSAAAKHECLRFTDHNSAEGHTPCTAIAQRFANIASFYCPASVLLKQWSPSEDFIEEAIAHVKPNKFTAALLKRAHHSFDAGSRKEAIAVAKADMQMSPPRALPTTAGDDVETADYRRRVTRIYETHAPGRHDPQAVEQALIAFANNKEALIDHLVAKYGPEPPETPVEPPQTSTPPPPAPIPPSSSDTVLSPPAAQAGSCRPRNPNPPATPESDLQFWFRRQLCLLFTEYDPSKLPVVDNIVLNTPPGKEKQVVSKYAKKLGPVPEEKCTAEERRILEKRLKRFYSEHDKVKVPHVDALVCKYLGQEEGLYNAMCDKYGADPRDTDSPVVIPEPPAECRLGSEDAAQSTGDEETHELTRVLSDSNIAPQQYPGKEAQSLGSLTRLATPTETTVLDGVVRSVPRISSPSSGGDTEELLSPVITQGLPSPNVAPVDSTAQLPPLPPPLPPASKSPETDDAPIEVVLRTTPLPTNDATLKEAIVADTSASPNFVGGGEAQPLSVSPLTASETPQQLPTHVVEGAHRNSPHQQQPASQSSTDFLEDLLPESLAVIPEVTVEDSTDSDSNVGDGYNSDHELLPPKAADVASSLPPIGLPPLNPNRGSSVKTETNHATFDAHVKHLLEGTLAEVSSITIDPHMFDNTAISTEDATTVSDAMDGPLLDDGVDVCGNAPKATEIDTDNEEEEKTATPPIVETSKNQVSETTFAVDLSINAVEDSPADHTTKLLNRERTVGSAIANLEQIQQKLLRGDSAWAKQLGLEIGVQLGQLKAATAPKQTIGAAWATVDFGDVAFYNGTGLGPAIRKFWRMILHRVDPTDHHESLVVATHADAELGRGIEIPLSSIQDVQRGRKPDKHRLLQAIESGLGFRALQEPHAHSIGYLNKELHDDGHTLSICATDYLLVVSFEEKHPVELWLRKLRLHAASNRQRVLIKVPASEDPDL